MQGARPGSCGWLCYSSSLDVSGTSHRCGGTSTSRACRGGKSRESCRSGGTGYDLLQAKRSQRALGLFDWSCWHSSHISVRGRDVTRWTCRLWLQGHNGLSAATDRGWRRMGLIGGVMAKGSGSPRRSVGDGHSAALHGAIAVPVSVSVSAASTGIIGPAGASVVVPIESPI